MVNPPAKSPGWNQKGMVDVGEPKPKPTGNATVDSMGLDKPYNPTEIRTSLENTYGKDKVISSTTPTDPPMRVNSNPDKGINVVYNDSGKVGAVRVEYKDPLTGEAKVANIPYDQRQLPVMDDVSKYTTNIDTNLGYKAQMREATRDLRQAIQNGKVDASLFTSEQLKAIDAGLEKIPDYTWHHNAQAGPNNFQLIPTKVHQGALHIGQGALSKGK